MIGNLLLLQAASVLYSSSIITFVDIPKDSILLPSTNSMLISDVTRSVGTVEQGVQSTTTTTTTSSSFDAARLLLNPLPKNTNPISSTSPTGLALQQLYKQRKLQDDRLEQCQSVGKDWEQCFFYGTPAAGSSSSSDQQQQEQEQQEYTINNEAKLFLSPSPFDLPKDISPEAKD